MSTPLAVVIDIDGTIIGEISPQVVEWELIKEYRPSYMRQFRNSLVDVLKTSLTRHGLSEMMNSLRTQFGERVEFFVYTASEHKWAHVVVPCIESAIGAKFARPIFTRNHMVLNKQTGTSQKSLERILPLMNSAFSKKGYTVSLELNNCILIDNNETLIPQESGRLVLCPTHKYTIYQDVLRFLSIDVIKQNLQPIIEILNQYDLFPSVDKNVNLELFYAHYYDMLGRNMSVRYKSNMEKDVMWKRTHKALHKYLSGKNSPTEFKSKFVKTLTTKISKK